MSSCFLHVINNTFIIWHLLYSLLLVSEMLLTASRQGSGSACRSMYGGFVEWTVGSRDDGTDSIAKQIATEQHWPNMHVLILVVLNCVYSVCVKPICCEYRASASNVFTSVKQEIIRCLQFLSVCISLVLCILLPGFLSKLCMGFFKYTEWFCHSSGTK